MDENYAPHLGGVVMLYSRGEDIFRWVLCAALIGVIIWIVLQV